MIPTLQHQRSWAKVYFFGLEFVVVALFVLITFGGWRGGDFFSVWPSWTLIALLFVLFVSSLLCLRSCTALAVSGLLVFAATVGAGFLFPVMIR